MSLFKVGDRVRVLTDSYKHDTFRIGGAAIEKGLVYSLAGHDGHHYYLKTDRDSNLYFHEDDLELVTEPGQSDNISVTTKVTVTILKHEYILTKEEAKELSDKLLKELS